VAVIKDEQSLKSNQFRNLHVEGAETPDRPKQPVNVSKLLDAAFVEFEASCPGPGAPLISEWSLK
jgi:hypothetical protein